MTDSEIRNNLSLSEGQMDDLVEGLVSKELLQRMRSGVLAATSGGKSAYRRISLVRPMGRYSKSRKEELLRHGELDTIGGPAYLRSLTDGTPKRQNISHHVKIVQDYAIRRAGAKTGDALQRLASDGSVSPSALAEIATKFAVEVDSGDQQPPRLSEEALALRFSRQHADSLRYVRDWGCWMYWEGTHWVQDRTLDVFDKARAICRSASAECGDHEKREGIRLASKSRIRSKARVRRKHLRKIKNSVGDTWRRRR